MRLVIQRVAHASVTVEGATVGAIDHGLLVLFGAHQRDHEDKIEWLANKLLNLRIFDDEQGKMNRSVLDVEGDILVVSQFTLYADCAKGRRPAFIESADPEIANELYRQFIDRLKKSSLKIEEGVFAAKMSVELLNDGPVTIVLDSKA